jgi:hypothetical protein
METARDLGMTIITVSRAATTDEISAEMDRRGSVIERLETNVRHWREECGKLHAQNAELVAALKGLVNRLDEIHDDPGYRSVWTTSQMHIGPYRGPTYVDALDNARAALAAAGHKP